MPKAEAVNHTVAVSKKVSLVRKSGKSQCDATDSNTPSVTVKADASRNTPDSLPNAIASAAINTPPNIRINPLMNIINRNGHSLG